MHARHGIKSHVDVSCRSSGPADILGSALAVSRRVYIGVLAIAALVILATGSLLRPIPAGPVSPEPPAADLTTLARLAERRTVDDLANVLSQAADRAALSVVRVSATGRSGIVWRPGLVISAAPPDSRPVGLTELQTPSGTGSAAWQPRRPDQPIVMLKSDDLPAPVERDTAGLRSGSWVVAVWRTATGRAFAPGYLAADPIPSAGAEQALSTTVPLTQEMEGGGLFDLEGRLAGVVAPGLQGPTLLTPAAIDAFIEQTATAEGVALARYGFRGDNLTADEQRYFGIEAGVIVRDLWDGSVAEERGLRPGDVITTINDAPVVALDDLASAIDAAGDGPLTLVTRWRRTTRTVTLSGDTTAPATDDGGTSHGVVWHTEPAGHLIADVTPGSRADRAGIRPGDRLMSVDRLPRTQAQAARAIAAPAAARVFLELQRGQRRWGTLF
jgi:S1-C subfamily serine protease